MAPRARRDPRSALTICFAAVIKRTVDGPTSNGTCAPRGPVEWRHRNSRSWHSRGTALAAGAASGGTRAAQSNGAPAAPAAGAAKIGGRRGSCGVARGALDGTRVARLDGALSAMAACKPRAALAPPALLRQRRTARSRRGGGALRPIVVSNDRTRSRGQMVSARGRPPRSCDTRALPQEGFSRRPGLGLGTTRNCCIKHYKSSSIEIQSECKSKTIIDPDMNVKTKTVKTKLKIETITKV